MAKLMAKKPDNTSAHFSYRELRCHTADGRDCPHCGGMNLCTPALLDALEDLRLVAGGVPIFVDSAYRCAAHNAEVGGAANSQHTRGTAADIRISGMSARQMYDAARLVTAFLHGGIGVAVYQNYIHVDVRLQTARWCYDAAGSQCAWDPALDRPETVST
jgi:hypothetical protein